MQVVFTPTEKPRFSPPAEGRVDLWLMNLDAPPVAMERLFDLLPSMEHARAERLYHAEHRRRWATARALLRTVLGGYLQYDPGAIEFRVDGEDKPAVEGLAFNLSHSRHLMLVGIASEGRLGVDVEHENLDRNVAGLARRFFTEKEMAELARVNSEEQCHLFHQFWVRKEALLKAWGTGLRSSLKSFDVSEVPKEREPIPGWHVYDLKVDPLFVGAFSWDRECVGITARQWTPVLSSS